MQNIKLADLENLKQYMHPIPLEVISRASNNNDPILKKSLYLEALSTADEYGDIISMAHCLMKLGMITLSKGDPLTAIQYYTSSHALLKQRSWFDVVSEESILQKYQLCEKHIFRRYNTQCMNNQYHSVASNEITAYFSKWPVNYRKYKSQLEMKKSGWGLVNKNRVSIGDLYRMNREIITLLQEWFDEAREYFRWVFYRVPTKHLRMQVVGLGNFATYDSPSYHNLKFSIIVSSGQRDYEWNKTLPQTDRDAQKEFIKCVTQLLYIRILSLGETKFIMHDHAEQALLNRSITPEGFGLDPLFLEVVKTSNEFIKDVESINILAKEDLVLPNTISFEYPEFELCKLQYWHHSLYMHPAPFLGNMRMHFGYTVNMMISYRNQIEYNKKANILAEQFLKNQARYLKRNISDSHVDYNELRSKTDIETLDKLQKWFEEDAQKDWQQYLISVKTKIDALIKIHQELQKEILKSGIEVKGEVYTQNLGNASQPAQQKIQGINITIRVHDLNAAALSLPLLQRQAQLAEEIISTRHYLQKLYAIDNVSKDIRIFLILSHAINFIKQYLISAESNNLLHANRLSHAISILLESLGMAFGEELGADNQYPCTYQGDWHLRCEPNTYYHPSAPSLMKWQNNKLRILIGKEKIEGLRETIMLYYNTCIVHEAKRPEKDYVYKFTPYFLKVDCQNKYDYLVFEGGGSKGYGYIGAIRALEEANILPNIKGIAGASAGAMTALVLALGYRGKELRERMQFFAEVPGLIKVALNAWNDQSTDPSKSNTAKLRYWISQAIKDKTGVSDITFLELHNFILQDHTAMEDLPDMKDLYVVVANTNTNLAEIRSYINSPDASVREAVVTSASVPFVTRRKETRESSEQLYTDGGVFKNYPINNFDWHLGPYGQDNKTVVNPKVLGFKADTNDEINVFLKKNKPFNKKKKNMLEFSISQDAGEGSQNTSFAENWHDIHRTVFINMRSIVVTTCLNDYPQLKNALEEDSYEATKLRLISDFSFKKLCEEIVLETKNKLRLLFHQSQFIRLCLIDSLEVRLIYILKTTENAQESFEYLKAITYISFMHLWRSEEHMIIDITISEIILESLNIQQELHRLDQNRINRNKRSKINQNIGIHEVTIEEFWKISSFPVGQKYGHLPTDNPIELQKKIEEQNILLYGSIQTNNVEEASNALVRGANPEYQHIQDNKTTSCLYLACSLGNTKIVELLLRNDNGSAEPNRKNSNGFTALDVALFQGHKDIVLLLLKANAATYTSVESSKGWPEVQAHQEIVDLLLKHNDGLKLKSVSM